MKTRSLEEVAKDIDEILKEFKDADEKIREKILKLLELIEEFNRIPLIKIVKHMKSSEEGKKILLELVRDPDIYALFLKYGIIKKDLKVEVAKVIEMIRPYVNSHGGDVELVDVKDNVVYVRMRGACQGCSQINITLKQGILEAIKERFPQIRDIKVVEDSVVEGFTDLRDNGNWIKIAEVRNLREGRPEVYRNEEIDVVLILWKGKVFCYKNSCAHQGLGFEGCEEIKNGILRCPWHGFEYDVTSGECITARHLQLEPVPVKVENGKVFIKV